MSQAHFAQAIICTEYEELLAKCQQAFIAVHRRREEVNHEQLTGIDVGRELLSLQAHFAKAYSKVRRHVKTCWRCQHALPSGAAAQRCRSSFLDVPA